ncbi:hypothetical protein ACFQPG_11210 [Sphingomonas sp. GCM10030256]|uniref:hypothetical protein n=1 Tax=Sphingomonas sp. GCM10030256 TaxID=3273427 RepID=UPI00361AC5E1
MATGTNSAAQHATGAPAVRPQVLLIGAALAAAAFLAFTPALLDDGDSSWHLATGQWILRHGAIPAADPFSFTARGQPWHAHEWLSEVAMAAAFALRGWSGVALLAAAAIAGTLLLLGREFLRRLPPLAALLALGLVAAALQSTALARPHALAWPLLAGWTLLLLHARERRRSPPLWATPLMILWANMHASYIVALGLVAVFALEALIEQAKRKAVVTGWAAFGLAALLCALLTPFRLQGFLYPFQVSGMDALALISEWAPSRWPDDALFFGAAGALAAMAGLRWREVGAVRLMLLAGLLGMAVTHSRHQPLLLIVGSLAVVQRAGRRQADRSGLPVSLLLAGAAALAAARLTVPLERGDRPNYPATALRQLPLALRTQPVFNSYSYGGPLILHGVAPFIDGRADMYGDGLTFRYQRIAAGDMAAFRQASARWDLRWTLLNRSEPLAGKLDQEPGWQRIHADRHAVIHVRR